MGYRDLVVYDIWAAALGKLEDAEDGPWREKGYGLIKMMCERWPRDWRVSPPQISNASFSILVSLFSAHLPRCKERKWFEEKGREMRLMSRRLILAGTGEEGGWRSDTYPTERDF